MSAEIKNWNHTFKWGKNTVKLVHTVPSSGALWNNTWNLIYVLALKMPVKPKTIAVSFSLIYYSHYNLYLIISLEMWVQDDGSWMCSRNVNTVCSDSRLQSEASATFSHPQPKKSESQCSSMVCSPFPKPLFEVTKWIWLTCAADICIEFFLTMHAVS